ncbi:MAG: BrnA antitoxin family protein [Tabrizicola sp.]
MFEDGPKRLSIAEKRALNGTLVLDAGSQVENGPDEVLAEHHWTDTVLPEQARKKLISLRVDPAVLEFFKAQGPGYQTRMNAVLQAYMQVKKEMGQG